MRTTLKSVAPVPGGFGYPLGFATGLLLLVGFIAAGATSRDTWPLIALVLVVAAVSATTTITAALTTALVHWALYASFVAGPRGDLIINAQTAQVAAGLALITISTTTLTNAARTAHARHAAREHEQPELPRTVMSDSSAGFPELARRSKSMTNSWTSRAPQRIPSNVIGHDANSKHPPIGTTRR